MKTIGQKIKYLRYQRGMSQGDVAKRIDISILALSKIENGITDINLSKLERIAALFEMSIIQLITLEDVKQDPPQHMTELETANRLLMDHEAEIIDLQKKIIELFEALRHSKTA
ncbi:helix-turn-helix domain-containing protein [Mucilaginibacter pocheonensis]|uniref:Transcriptional regulator with XRE-family HTH domain n=1 Tax=Mucilaginibacter pocheonensis TaxID=398050 RepID=A0ABU1TG48_9SPHI|nr:helix-turn-helix transcriptional regulator [Mucilaginibacter pocheonensis]MDR6944279.1 transcriptional regulator with XRE-family HTH domain [Mucilaginibacter pocheonensis]